MRFIKHENKFVRAWSYNALFDISKRYNHNQSETMNLLLEAEKNEAPSVKARIRNIIKS